MLLCAASPSFPATSLYVVPIDKVEVPTSVSVLGVKVPVQLVPLSVVCKLVIAPPGAVKSSLAERVLVSICSENVKFTIADSPVLSKVSVKVNVVTVGLLESITIFEPLRMPGFKNLIFIISEPDDKSISIKL